MEIPPTPIVAGGMVCSTWGQTGKMMGGGKKNVSLPETPTAAAHHFPLTIPQREPQGGTHPVLRTGAAQDRPLLAGEPTGQPLELQVRLGGDRFASSHRTPRFHPRQRP